MYTCGTGICETGNRHDPTEVLGIRHPRSTAQLPWPTAGVVQRWESTPGSLVTRATGQATSTTIAHGQNPPWSTVPAPTTPTDTSPRTTETQQEPKTTRVRHAHSFPFSRGVPQIPVDAKLFILRIVRKDDIQQYRHRDITSLAIFQES